MDLGIKGRTALVFGGSRGLGFASAQALGREGAKIVIVSRHSDSLGDAERRLKAAGAQDVRGLALDLADVAAVSQWLDLQQDLLGSVDILINNTGGPAPTAAQATTLDQWRQGFDALFLSTTRISQAVLPGMKSRGWGRILTITSTAVVEPIDHLAVSTTMRAAVSTFSKLLATEVARDGITVNTVMPGVIHTDRITNLRRAKAEREGTTLDVEMTKTANSIPVGRMGRPEELGDLVAFLASERAGFLTGCAVPLDGGARRSWT